MPLHAVIMAGGRGERFWPLSTNDVPKPFIPLLGSGSLIQDTVERVRTLIPLERIYISIGEAQNEIARRQLPKIPENNFIVEPVGRDTSACIGYCALHLELDDPDAVMLALPADHYIRQRDDYARTIQRGVEGLAGCNAVVFGIVPDRPETGYGYVQAEKPSGAEAAWPVKRFVEKPDPRTAEQYLRSGDFFWNSGIFLWQVKTLLGLFHEHLPETWNRLSELRPLLRKAGAADEIMRIFSSIQRISIDFGILEKTSGLRLVPAEFEWDDIGTWAALDRVLPVDAGGNIALGPHAAVASEGCITYSDAGVVALLGVKDLVVVQAHGKVLVCPKSRASDLKRLVTVLGPQ
jgi:mannose-1-phosphate guanylyltransferase